MSQPNRDRQNFPVFSILDQTEQERADCRLIKDFLESEYRRKPLRYTNLDSVRTGYAPRMQATFSAASAMQPRRRIVRFDEATIFNSGAVRLPDGALVLETLQDNKHIHEKVVDVTFDGIPIEAGNFALLRKAGDSNYGHWLIELATRALDFEQANLPSDTRYLVARHPSSLMKLRADTLEICGISSDRIEWIDGEPRRFQNVYVCTPNSIHSHTHYEQKIRELIALASSQVADRGGPIFDYGTKIFIGRREGLQRRALNEEQIYEECRKFGYIKIDPFGLSLLDQIRIFAQATHIVAVFGAALTNMIWARPGCQIAALTADMSADYFFWDIAGICSHEYSAIFGPSVNQSSHYVHQDFTIDILELRKYLSIV